MQKQESTQPRLAGDGMDERRWALLALTSVGAFIAPLQGSIVAVALPTMGPALHLSFAAILWVQASYLLSMAVLLIPLGRLADQRGRVRFYLAGIALFTLGSVASALSFNGTTLILSRIFQGVGGALLSATAGALVTSAFPSMERGRALGISVMATYAGLSVGPPLGGFLVDRFGWPWIFWITLPIGVFVLVWGWRFLRWEEHGPQEGRRADLPGAALLGTMLTCLLVPLTFAPEWGWSGWNVWLLLGLALLSAGAFLKREMSTADPLLDLDLLRHNRLFAMANVAALLNYFALHAINILTAVHLQLVLGHPARIAGWIMLGQPLMQSTLSPLAGRLSDRIGSRLLSTAGMVITALGMVLLARMGNTSSIAYVMGSLAVVGLGMAAFSAPNTSAIMGSVEKSRLSVASAFLGTMRVTGQALSVAILGGIAAAHLGPGGWRSLLKQGAASNAAADAFAQGYKVAMFTGAALALLGAWASLTRGPHAHEPDLMVASKE